MTINCKGKLIDLSTPKVMGILNVTPDSFFDGGKFKSENELLKQVEFMLKEGADFIDIGAYSSRPGADYVAEEDEKKRLLPMLDLILSNFPETILSIDTFRASIAKSAIENGAAIINDISAGHLDEGMLATVAELRVPYIMMHMKGEPKTMQSLNTYEDMMKEIAYYFSERISVARKLGISDLIIDPGFGFAKDLLQNYELLNNLSYLSILDLPLLVGVSRKSMIYKLLEITPNEALNGTTVLNTLSLLNGASILRVHDVKEAKQTIKIFNTMNSL